MHHCLFFFSFFCLLWKWARAFLRIFCTKSHWLKSLAIQPKLLAEQDLVSPFFFHLDFFCIRTSYYCKLGQEGKIPRFSFLLWIGQSYQGEAQRSAWLRSSQVQRSQSRWGRPPLPNCSLPRRRSGRCRRPQKSAARERVEWGVQCSWNTEEGLGGRNNAETSGEHVVPRPQQERRALQGLLEKSVSLLQPYRQLVAPNINCLTANFSGITVLP